MTTQTDEEAPATSEDPGVQRAGTAVFIFAGVLLVAVLLARFGVFGVVTG